MQARAERVSDIGPAMLPDVLVLRRDRTEDLDPTELALARALMDAAFSGDFDDEDWRHSIGGVHVRGLAGGHLVAHASVVQRSLWCGDTHYRTGYVEAVAVAPADQRRGYGAAVMREVEQIIRDRYELGALSTSAAAQRLYSRLGWQTWLGPSYVQTATGRVPTPDDDGGIMVLPVAGLDISGPITCGWREGDVW